MPQIRLVGHTIAYSKHIQNETVTIFSIAHNICSIFSTTEPISMKLIIDMLYI